MTRDTRYEPYMEPRTRTVQTVLCDGLCGTLVDIPPLGRPDGWISVFRQVEGRAKTWDFCGWDCFIGWATEQDESVGGYIDDWKQSIKVLETRKDKTASDYLEDEFAAVLATGEQEREE